MRTLCSASYSVHIFMTFYFLNRTEVYSVLDFTLSAISDCVIHLLYASTSGKCSWRTKEFGLIDSLKLSLLGSVVLESL